MIFGFNTYIKFDQVVYHVQSEARQGERLLQTQIFVRGQCVGKKAASFAELVGSPDFSEERMHEMLKDQHRATVDNLRAGRIEEAMTSVTPLRDLLSAMTQADATVVPESDKPEVISSHLQLEFLNPDCSSVDNSVLVRFRVEQEGAPRAGAKLIAKLTTVGSSGLEGNPVFAQTVTGGDGSGTMVLPVSVAEMSQAVLLVQAVHEGKSAMKKFRLKASAL